MAENHYEYLNRINSPADLKALREDEIAPLAAEIRSFLVDKVGKNGGHLASNLGVVELTLAIHRVFDLPKDHLIFDVGHQSYVHKIITERKDRFDELRQPNGLSGFTKRSESEYDCFGAGHSSTSVSAGLGFAQADKLCGNDATTIVVLGDGAFTGGMVHEALNNCEKKLKLIIILNENEMSISKNIGRFAKVLSRVRMKSSYINTKQFTGKILLHVPFIGKKLYNFVRRVKKLIKNVFYGSNYFENLGLFYIGPIDGNNEKELEIALNNAKRCNESVIIHVKTVKGKGYDPAEKDPSFFHGISSGEADPCESFSSRFGDELVKLAEKDEKVCAITAAMLDGTGLCEFKKRFPTRTFDVGIAEEHAVTFASGLAAEGMNPYVAIYSTFLQWSYDNIIHDMALQGLPVTLCIDRAGLNPSDGATHHGIFDVAFLSQVPNMTIFTPVTYDGLALALEESRTLDRPCAIRYNKGSEIDLIKQEFYGDATPKKLGIRASYTDPDAIDALVIAYGRIAKEAIAAKKMLSEQGIRLGIILAEKLKPYGELADEIEALLPQKEIKIVTLEEEIKAGGFGMLLFDALSSREIMKNKKTAIMALDNTFAEAYSSNIYKSFGIDAESIVKKILESI